MVLKRISLGHNIYILAIEFQHTIAIPNSWQSLYYLITIRDLTTITEDLFIFTITIDKTSSLSTIQSTSMIQGGVSLTDLSST